MITFPIKMQRLRKFKLWKSQTDAQAPRDDTQGPLWSDFFLTFSPHVLKLPAFCQTSCRHGGFFAVRSLLSAPCMECSFWACSPDKIVLTLPDSKRNVFGAMSRKETVQPLPLHPASTCTHVTLGVLILSSCAFLLMICQQQLEG